MVLIALSVVRLNDDFFGSNAFYRSGMLCNNTHTGVHRSLCLHTGTNYRSLGRQKRHGLTLHVRSHQRAVCVVILQERNQRRSDGEHHLRRYVHVVEHCTVVLLRLLTVTAGYGLADKMPFFVQGLVRLRYMVIILFIRCHVYNLIGNTRILRIGFIDHTVRCFDEAVLVDSCIGCQRVDQTDVRTLRGLDRAHSSVMGVMYVTHLKSGSVTGQTARTERGQTSLVRQLAQRVVLVHELRQLGGTEELLHRCRHRFDVDQRLRRDSLKILRGHTLTDNSLQSGKTDAVLVLQKLADRTDTTVSEMVDIVVSTDPIFQMDIIVNGSKNIFLCNMLRDQIVDIAADRLFDILEVTIFFQYRLQRRIIY